MTRALLTAALVTFLAGSTALAVFDDEPRQQFGSGDRVAAHDIATAPVDNVPDHPPGVKATAVARKVRAASASVEVVPIVGEIPDLIRAGFARFGAHVAEEAVRVASCETGGTFSPTATNGVHAGLFQLSGRYHQERAARLGFSWAQMWEAAPNIAVAADLYAEQGWGPWECKP